MICQLIGELPGSLLLYDHNEALNCVLQIKLNSNKVAGVKFRMVCDCSPSFGLSAAYAVCLYVCVFPNWSKHAETSLNRVFSRGRLVGARFAGEKTLLSRL